MGSHVEHGLTSGGFVSTALRSASQELRQCLFVPLKIGNVLLLHVGLIESVKLKMAYFDIVNRHYLVVENVFHHDWLDFGHAHSHRLGFSVGALLIVHWSRHIQAIILNLNFKLGALHSLTTVVTALR